MREAYSNVGSRVYYKAYIDELAKQIQKEKHEGKNVYDSLSPEEFPYYYDNGNQKFGFEELTEDSIIKWAKEQNVDIQKLNIDINKDKYIYNGETGYRINGSIGELANQIQLKPSERNFDEEYLAALNISENAVDELGFTEATAPPSFSALLQKDPELNKMIKSLNANDGEYNLSDVRRYLFNKVYGASATALAANRNKTALSLDQMYYLADQLDIGANISSNDLSTVADAIGKSAYWVSQNKSEAGTLYRAQAVEQEAQAIQGVRSELMNRLGSLQTIKYLSDNEIEALNSNNEKKMLDFDTEAEAEAHNFNDFIVHSEATGKWGTAVRDWQIDGAHFKDNTGWYETYQSFDDYYKSLSDEDKAYFDDLISSGYSFSIGEDNQLKIFRNGKAVDFDEYANARNFDTIRTQQESANLVKRVINAASRMTEIEGKTIWDQILDNEQIDSDEAEYLKQNAPELFKYYNMAETQRNSVEGKALKQQIDIQIKTAGMAELEQVGDLLEGTTQLVENLQKNGRIKIEAEFQLRSEAFQSGQLSAALLKGNFDQQASAAMQMLNMNEQEFYANGLEGARSNISIAQSIARSEQWQASEAMRYEKLYEEAETAEDRLGVLEDARRAGFEPVDSNKEPTEEWQEAMAAEYKSRYEAAQTNEERSRIENEAYENGFRMAQIRDIINNKYSGTFTFDATLPRSNTLFGFNEDLLELYNLNPFLTAAVSKYTSENIASAAMGMMRQNNVDDSLRDAVFQSGMENLKRYLALREQDKLKDFDLEEQQRIERLANQDITTYRLQDLEQRGQVISGTSSLYQNLISESEEQRRSARQSIVGMLSNIGSMNQGISILERYQNDENMWRINGQDRAKQIAQMAGITDEAELEYYSKRENFSKLRKEVEKRGEEIQRSIMTAMGSAFNISTDSFSSLGDMLNSLNNQSDEAQRGLANVITELLTLAGIDLNNFGNLTKEPITAKSVVDAAANVQNVDEDTKNRATMNRFSELVNSGRYDTVEGAYQQLIDEGHFADMNEAEEFFRKYPNVADNVMRLDEIARPNRNDYATGAEFNVALGYWNRQKGQHAITPEFAENMRQESDYGIMFHDPTFMQGWNMFTGLYEGGITQDEIQSILNSGDKDAFVEWISQFEDGAQALEQLQENGKILPDTLARLNAQMTNARSKDIKKYGEYTDEVGTAVENLAKGGKSASDTMMNFGKSIKSVNDKYVAAQRVRGKAGKDLGNEDLKQFASATGYSEEEIKQMGKQEINSLAGLIEQAANDEFANGLGGQIVDTLQSDLNAYVAANGVHFDVSSIGIEADGEYDLSEISAIASALGDEALAEMASHAGTIGELRVLLEKNGMSETASLIFSKLTGKDYSSRRSGGGGGSGKSDTQKLIERLKREKELSDHRLKMLQYTQTFYEERGEYTNMAGLLPTEKNLRLELIEEYEKAIEDLVAQMSKTKKESDDWYSLRESILAYEEAIEECKNAIDKINRTQEEYYQNARKTRTALEQTVDQEIRNRIQRERDMLDGTVSMENTILDAIKARYQEEWDLVTRDIEKKRQALEEEKSLIDERLNARKEAEDEAQKYEELAELRQQYSLVSMDSTRTKDAAELRQKISDIEKEIMWKQMEDEAKAQQDALDDQINAYDQFTENGDEDLQALLENANNFADEVNSVLYEKQDDLFNWLKENVADYANSLDEMQKQMINSWTDTYKQMWGITDVFWAQINGVLMTEDEFIAYMKESQDYINASDTDKEIMEQDWKWAYQDYVSAYLTGAAWDHSDEFNQYGTAANSGNGNGSGKKTDVPQLSVAGAVAGAMNYLNQLMTSETKKWMDMMSGPEKITVEYSKYDSGGLVDYTGPAWVDGTPSRPEAFLSAEDTALIRGWLDSAKYVRTRAYMSNIDSSNFSGATNTIGDVNITITEASFKDDADYEEVAERVGQVFVKEIAKQGFMTPAFAF